MGLQGGLFLAWKFGVDIEPVRLDKHCIYCLVYSDPLIILGYFLACTLLILVRGALIFGLIYQSWEIPLEVLGYCWVTLTLFYLLLRRVVAVPLVIQGMRILLILCISMLWWI
jgi:hypothetical protein